MCVQAYANKVQWRTVPVLTTKEVTTVDNRNYLAFMCVDNVLHLRKILDLQAKIKETNVNSFRESSILVCSLISDQVSLFKCISMKACKNCFCYFFVARYSRIVPIHTLPLIILNFSTTTTTITMALRWIPATQRKEVVTMLWYEGENGQHMSTPSCLSWSTKSRIDQSPGQQIACLWYWVKQNKYAAWWK